MRPLIPILSQCVSHKNVVADGGERERGPQDEVRGIDVQQRGGSRLDFGAALATRPSQLVTRDVTRLSPLSSRNLRERLPLVFGLSTPAARGHVISLFVHT